MTSSAVYRSYLEALDGCTARLRETPETGSELEWQARWFSGACGRQFTTTSGEKAVILDFGEWNREAGPDFVRATALIEGREKTGAIEVDLDASGWEQHRHATNPDYAGVILHVFIRRPKSRHFSRTADNAEVPQICLAGHPAVSAEWHADASARPGRCTAPLRKLGAPALSALLAAAARRRFELKGAALETMIASRGADAALYEAIAIALGYKHNKLPFQLLAQRVPRRLAASPRGEALLFGVAGFLDRPQPSAASARDTAAGLWASWWKQRAAFANSILPPSAWKLAGVRPANHPLRRIAALHAITRLWKSVRAAIEAADAVRLSDILGSLHHPFWSCHATWKSPARTMPLALIGSGRIRDIHANIALPLAFVRGNTPSAWLDMPASEPNTAIQTALVRLFGADSPRRLPRKLFVQQGLLQIYQDFCLRDHSGCEHCRFPTLVERLAG